LVHEKRPRELCDVLLGHECGAVLIESKALDVLVRQILPDRETLALDLQKQITKATRQLKGGIKNLRRGLRITNQKGDDLEVNRNNTPHAIILVPDLSLLNGAPQFGGTFLQRFCNDSNAFLQILDTAELLRVVQAAEAIAKARKSTNIMIAFEFYLLERFKRAVTMPTPDFCLLLRRSPGSPEGPL
jgi:hypothetical protein